MAASPSLSLLTRISRHDTWPELERAALARYWDGFVLAGASDHRGTGAIYLFGYAIEMLLKTAYYRLRGIAGQTDLEPELRNVRQRAEALGFRWRGNYHNLDSWVRLLIEQRRTAGGALDPVTAGQLRRHVSLITSHWSEVLRYKDTAADETDVQEVFDSVEWIRERYSVLWRT